MTGHLFTLPGVDGRGVIPHQAWCQAHQGEGRPSVILSLQMMMEHPVMPLIMTGPFVGGMEVQGVERTKVPVTLMIHAPLKEAKEKGWIF